MSEPLPDVDLSDPGDVASKADQSPFARLTGARITHVEPGLCRAEMPIEHMYVGLAARPTKRNKQRA